MTKKIRLHTVSCLVVFLMLSGIVMSQEKAPSVLEKREAEKAWEELIRAKGGREKLHSITDMITEYLHVTHLYVFPASDWHFTTLSDERKTPLLDVWDESLLYVCNSEGVYSTQHRDHSASMAMDQVTFLLETKWTKPELLSIARIREGKKQL